MKILIVGAGKLGSKIAEALVDEALDITVVDRDAEALSHLNEHLDVLTVNANALDFSILKELNIESYDLLCATTDSDETNTLLCTVCKKMGCTTTIARIRNPEYSQQIDFIKKELGIDYVINPDLSTAIAITDYLIREYAVAGEGLCDGRIRLFDFHVADVPNLIGKTLKESKIYFEDIVITTISRDGNIIIPHGNTVVEAQDVIYLMGKSNAISKFKAKFSLNEKHGKVQDVIILGGGKLGFYLAKKLGEEKIFVTIIEQNLERCEYLSEELPGCLVIHGDGTDMTLLEEEAIGSKDAFVGTSGFDEENLLMAIAAKQLGVERSVAKISRSNYNKIIDKLSIDAAFNPIIITASSILKLIRGGTAISVSLLLGGAAEVMELVMEDGVPILNKPIRDINVAKGVIIGAIVKQDRSLIIPTGDTVIERGDRLVVFFLKENTQDLAMFFKRKRGGIFDGLWNHI